MKYMIHNWRGKPDVPCVYNKYYTSNTSTINHSKHLNFVTLQQLKEDFPNMKDFHIPHWSAWHHPLSSLPMYYVHVLQVSIVTLKISPAHSAVLMTHPAPIAHRSYPMKRYLGSSAVECWDGGICLKSQQNIHLIGKYVNLTFW